MMIMRVRHLVFSLVRVAAMVGVATCFVLPWQVAAQALSDVSVRGWDHDTYGRLSFDWPSPVLHRAEIRNGVLEVIFNRSFTPDFAGVKDRLADYVSDMSVAADGRSVRFSLVEPVTLRSFASGDTILVDLVRIRHADEGTIDEVADIASQILNIVPQAGPSSDAFSEGTLIEVAQLDDEIDRSGATRTLLRLRFGEHEKFGRIVFDWNRRVGYRLETTAESATIYFDTLAAIDWEALEEGLPAPIKAMKPLFGNGPLTVQIDVGQAYRLRHLYVGEKVVIDIAALADADVAFADDSGAVVDMGESAPAVLVAEEDAPESSDPVEEVLNAEPDEAVIEADTQTSEAQSDESIADLETSEPAVEASREIEADADEPEVDAELAMAETDEEQDSSPEMREEAVAEEESEPTGSGRRRSEIALDIAGAPDGAKLTFNWSIPVAAAVFVRAGVLWAVFDSPARFDIVGETADPAIIRRLAPIGSRGHTVARFALGEGYSPTVVLEDTVWHIDIGVGRAAVRPVKVEVTSAPDEPSRIFLARDNPGNEVLIVDPVVGDELAIIPLFDAGFGSAPARRFVDVELLETVQGIALRPISDSISVRALRDGVEVTSLSGLRLSDPPSEEEIGTQEVEPEFVVASAKDPTIVFDFEAWRRVDGRSYRDSAQHLNLKLALTSDDKRGDARLELARFHFANGRVPETLGWLERAAVDFPSISRDREFRALRGAANLLQGRVDAARRDLFESTFDDSREMALWRGAYHFVDGNNEAANIEFARSGNVVNRYPDGLRQRMRLLAAEAAALGENTSRTASILESILIDEPEPDVLQQVNYLEGLGLATEGRVTEAVEKYEAATTGGARRVRAEAGLARVELMLANDMMSLAEGVEAIEDLRFTWRGDDLELKLMRRLGDLYLKQGAYAKGLEVYREAVSVFPDSAEVREVTQAMNDFFKGIFLNGAANEMPPVAALALYYGFRELTPVGNEGDQMIYHLADRLVSVDLLEEAAELLRHQVEYRLRGADLARVGARLAEIYLLDDLPDRAARVLRTSEVARLPDAVADHRRYLLGRAYNENGDHEKALALLAGDQSREANTLRADIYWAKKDWVSTATAIDRLLGDRTEGAPLDPVDSQYVLKMAVSTALANNREGLTDLRNRYGKLMDVTSNGKAFRTVASFVDGGAIEPGDMTAAVAEIDTYDAYLTSLRARVSDDALSAIN